VGSLKSIFRSFERWNGASPLTKRRFIWAAVQIIRVDFRLRRAGFISTRDDLLERRPPQNLLFDATPRELARVINTAARFTIGRRNSCLRRSLLLWWILDNRGIDCDLCMGMKFDGSILTAHAWVEVDGVPINDRKDIREKYDVLDFDGQLSGSEIKFDIS